MKLPKEMLKTLEKADKFVSSYKEERFKRTGRGFLRRKTKNKPKEKK